MPWTQAHIFVGSHIKPIYTPNNRKEILWGSSTVGRPPYVTKAERRQQYLDRQASIALVKSRYAPETRDKLLSQDATSPYGIPPAGTSKCVQGKDTMVQKP